jgi:hypothetical protein
MTKRVRIAVMMLLLILGATSLMATDEGLFVEFYTDESYTQMCGYNYLRCDGTFVRGGCRTLYSIDYPITC